MNQQNLRPPDEKEIIKAYENKYKLTTDEPGYIISAQWLKEWKRYVDFDNKSVQGSKPGEINNSSLVGEDKALRKDAILGLEFFVLPKLEWETFFGWYGGGPELAVEIAHDPVRNRNVPVFRVSTFKLCFGSTIKSIKISKYKPVNDLMDLSMQEFGFDKKMFHLRNYEGRIPGEILDSAKIICEYGLNDNQEILVEENTATKITPDTIECSKSLSTMRLKEAAEAQEKFDVSRRSISLACLSDMTLRFPGTAGLLNLGNTCYMNSILQCLFHTPSFLHFLESAEWCSIPNRGELLGVFASLLKICWSGSIQVCNPHDLKDVIDRISPDFRGNSPHDAHEFLGVLLKSIHDDLNKATGKPQSIKSTLDPTKAWSAMKQTDDSPIIDIFFGMSRHTLCCPFCNHRQSSFEPFMTLPLPMPQRIVSTAQFVFVPANPIEPMRSMKLKLFEDATLEEFDEGLSLELKRKVSIAFADIQTGAHKAVWLPNYVKPHSGHDIYAFEIDDHWKLHVVVWLCIKIRKPLSKHTVEIGTPYVVSIKDENTTSTQILELCEDFFKYLWEGRKGQLTDDLKELKEKLQSFSKPWARRFKIKLEHSIFSKTMRFKPVENAPWISRRNVYAVLNSDYIAGDNFNWSMLRRQLRNAATMPTNRSCAPLNYCFNSFMKEEILDAENLWYCSGCGEAVAAKSQTALWQLPKVLIIHFKRFFMDGFKLIKNDTFVKYPLILDMKDHLVGPSASCRYRLFAITEHQGSLTGGHYEAKCYVESTNKWFQFSDTSVKECPEQNIVSPHAYLLFYQRIE